jgi:hypothetical protein
MLLRRALPAAHFDRNATTPVTDLVHEGVLLRQFRGSFASKIAAGRLKCRLQAGLVYDLIAKI